MKYVVQNVAHAYGKTATFMPKPIVGDNGSGMHVHQSVWKDGKNLFAGDGYAGLSDFALYYIGGIIKHARALNAITNPGTNSYKRLVPGFEAPVKLAYSASNRSASIRIPYVANPKGRRIEARFPDPLMNPYLGFAALLMAGLDGVENKIHPGEAATKDLYHLPPEEDAKIPTVCHSLDQALEYLDKDRGFLTKGGVFTDSMHRCLHRAEDAGSHALPHGDAPGRVRHVLLAVISCHGAVARKGRHVPSFFCWQRSSQALVAWLGNFAFEVIARYWQAVLRISMRMEHCMKYALLIPAPAGRRCCLRASSHAQAPIYRCGNEYTNNAADAQANGLQAHRRRQRHRGAGHAVNGRQPAAGRRAPQRGRRPARASTRPTSARATATRAPILEAELKKAEARQAELLKEYNNGEPEKLGTEHATTRSTWTAWPN